MVVEPPVLGAAVAAALAGVGAFFAGVVFLLGLLLFLTGVAFFALAAAVWVGFWCEKGGEWVGD